MIFNQGLVMAATTDMAGMVMGMDMGLAMAILKIVHPNKKDGEHGLEEPPKKTLLKKTDLDAEFNLLMLTNKQIAFLIVILAHE